MKYSNNDTSLYYKRKKRVYIEDLDFQDYYVVYNGIKIDCSLSRKEYNSVKRYVDRTVDFSYTDKIKLYELCMKLENAHNKLNSERLQISASVVDFYDGYVVYNGNRYDDKRSLFKYNAFKKLKNLPPIIVSKKSGRLLMNPLIEVLKEYDSLTSDENIKAYFAEKVMKLGTNLNALAVEMTGNFVFLRHSYKYLPANFVRQYIDKGCDLKELPFYIIQINSESLKESIKNSLDNFQYKPSYQQMFGETNYPDDLLNILVEKIKTDVCIDRFIPVLQKSMLFTPTYIDGEFEGFNISVVLDELIQNGGNSLKEDCNFRSTTTRLLVDLNNYHIMLFSEQDYRSSILFQCDKNNWQLALYFLYNYYGSECRYKRSYLPCDILRDIGVVQIVRTYKDKGINSFFTGTWFTVRNNHARQKLFVKLARNLIKFD